MTQLELFHKTMAHEYTGQYLFHCGFITETFRKFREYYDLPEDISFYDKFGMYAPYNIEMKAPDFTLPAPDFMRYYKDMEIPANAYINHIGVLNVPGSAYHFTRYISPLRNVTSVTECRDFPFVDCYGWTDEGMADHVKEAHHQGRVAVMGVGGVYEEAWQIRGYEQFLIDMIDDPAIPFFILGRIHDRELKRYIAAAKAGMDVIHTGDDVATQRSLIMSPELWRRFIKPLHKELNDVAHAINPEVKILYHSDGDISNIIPELIDIGVDILNPLQPECMDLKKLKSEFGKHIVFDGTIGTQSTMPFGTPDDVRKKVAENKKLYGYDGALMISPTHVLEPEVPPENIMAFLEACADCGNA